MSDLGERIRARRLELGLTVREAAALCGISYQTISAIERGATTRTSTLDRIAEGLGFSLSREMIPAPSGRDAIVERFRAVIPNGSYHLTQSRFNVRFASVRVRQGAQGGGQPVTFCRYLVSHHWTPPGGLG